MVLLLGKEINMKKPKSNGPHEYTEEEARRLFLEKVWTYTVNRLSDRGIFIRAKILEKTNLDKGFGV